MWIKQVLQHKNNYSLSLVILTELNIPGKKTRFQIAHWKAIKVKKNFFKYKHEKNTMKFYLRL